MSEPFIGEIRMVGFNFNPRGWAFCNGQTLNISQNAALFSLLGTTYGGNGTSTFALPDMQSRFPIDQGTGAGLSTFQLGLKGGNPTVTLTANNLPAHQHTLSQANSKLQIGAVNAAATTNTAKNHALATTTDTMYTNAPPDSVLHGGSVVFGNGSATDATGSSIPVTTLPPYLCVNFIIALVGIYPTRS